MPTLSSSQRKHLRRLAHDLTPMVQIGKQGLTDHLLHNVSQALNAHELIKVKIVGGLDDVEALTAALVAGTESQLVSRIGGAVILYRQHPDPDARKVELSH